MKRLVCFFLAVSMGTSIVAEIRDFEVVIKPLWQNLEKSDCYCQQFGGKWILVGNITFKNKSKETVNLNRLYLHWNGSQITNLVGSLYTSKPDKDFLPIEDNLICDGAWNAAKQTLKLQFDSDVSVGAMNVFYLVLTIPHELEQTVRHGNFEIIQKTLPAQFRAHDQELRLALDVHDITTSELD